MTASDHNYLVTAIVSTYKSERFMRGCLEDLINQTLYGKGELEIVIIDSASPENEGDIVREFQKSYRNIHYIRTSERETIYAAWNRAIKSSSGKYLTNANTDDRHRQDALEILATELEIDQELALVYADQIITKTENESFSKCSPIAFFAWPEFDRTQLIHCSCIGPQPMWRRSLHDKLGWFNENLKVAGDYDWWLRISETLKIKHIPMLLGLYLMNSNGLEIANAEICDSETVVLRKSSLEKAGIQLDFKKYAGCFLVQTYPGITDFPLVSVIVPTYNRPEMLVEALTSIENQTFRNFEVIVVNDAGIDVAPAINHFSNKCEIRYINKNENQGLAAARNTGIRAARGKYISYLDDDDIFYPQHLQTLVDFLEQSNYRVAYTDAYRATQKKQGDRYVTEKLECLYSRDFDHNAILVDNFIPVLCVMHEKECLSASGMFDESLPRHEDWDLWIRMSRNERFAHLDVITCQFTYRDDGSGMTSGTLPMFLRTYREIYRKYSGPDFLKPGVSGSRKASLFNAVFRAFQFIGERVRPFVPEKTLNRATLDSLLASGATNRQIESAFYWQTALSEEEDSSVQLLEKALRTDCENHPARIALCERYLKAARHRDALSHMEVLAEANPLEPDFIKTADSLRGLVEPGAATPLPAGAATFRNGDIRDSDEPISVAVFSLDAPHEACARLRLLSPMETTAGALEARWGVVSDGRNCTTDLDLIDQADLIVIQRFYPRKGTVPYLERMLASGKPVIYEVDDLLTNLPDGNNLRFWAGETAELLPWLLPKVTAITVSTPALAQVFSAFNPSVHVVPNAVDSRLFRSDNLVSNGPVVIGFSGTPTHAADLEQIEEVLFRVADRYGNKVAFTFMGYATDRFSSLPGFRFMEFQRAYESYGKALSSSGIDIAVVPLQDNRFNSCKSNIKWLEYSACGIAGIYADLPPYNTSVEHGVSGVLVDDDPDKWFQAICLLVDHPQLRTRIAQQAKREVLSKYSLEDGAKALYCLYENIAKDNYCTKIA